VGEKKVEGGTTGCNILIRDRGTPVLEIPHLKKKAKRTVVHGRLRERKVVVSTGKTVGSIKTSS